MAQKQREVGKSINSPTNESPLINPYSHVDLQLIL